MGIEVGRGDANGGIGYVQLRLGLQDVRPVVGYFRGQTDGHVGRQGELGKIEVRRRPGQRAFAGQDRQRMACRIALLGEGGNSVRS